MPTTPQTQVISQPLTLPCGKRLPNRLVKAPMEELLADFGGGLPNRLHHNLYNAWAKGGWGMIITGNVAIDDTHLGTPFDVVLPKPPYLEDVPESEPQQSQQANSATNGKLELLESFRAYADSVTGRSCGVQESNRPLAVVQLVHAGRQSMRGSGRSVWQPAKAPSSVPMRPSDNLGIVGRALDHFMWGTPKEMDLSDIQEVKLRYAQASRLCYLAGFDGVELHASHGYLLAAFLSPKTNLRTDRYGGSNENRARLLLEIVQEVRNVVPPTFALGVKLNSCDYVSGGLTEEDALLNVKWLAETGGVDFIEISGGNYENPSFIMDDFDSEAEKVKLGGGEKKKEDQQGAKGEHVNPVSSRTRKREAFFQSFAKRCRSVVPERRSEEGEQGGGGGIKLILTGGLRTRNGISGVISSGDVDAAALARPAALYPDLASRLTDPTIPDGDPRADTPAYKVPAIGGLSAVPLKLVGAGWGTLWHSLQMSVMARGDHPNAKAGSLGLIWSHFSQSTGTRKPSATRSLTSSLLQALFVSLLALVGRAFLMRA